MNKKQKKSLIIASVVGVVLTGATVAGVVLTQVNKTGTNNSRKNSSSQISSKAAISSGSSEIDWSKLPTTEVNLANFDGKITEAGTYVLSGSTTESVNVSATGNVRIILSGANINAQSGAAIYTATAENLQIEAKAGTTNSLSDSSTRANEENEGVVSTTGNLIIAESGAIKTTANYKDGFFAEGDILISDAMLEISAKNGKGIESDASVVVDSGVINVPSSEEGIEGATVTINGGKIDIYATDDGINAASDTASEIYIKITGGEISVEVADGDTDGLDSNGDIRISGGAVRVTARSSFDYDGKAEFTGGEVYVNGQKVDSIPNQFGSVGTGGASGSRR